MRGTPCCWRLECHPACPRTVRDEKGRLSPDASAFPGTSPQGHSLRAFPGARGAATALGTTRDPPGSGEEFVRVQRGEFLEFLNLKTPHNGLVCLSVGNQTLGAQRDSPMDFVLQPGSGDP